MTSILKPYGRSLTDGWEWDGKIFKPYGRSLADGWEWDGRVFKPYGRSLTDGWEWDGKIFKPYGRSLADGWEWDGKVFKPYGRSLADGWEWDGRVFKPYGRSLTDGWEVSGDIPIYIIAFACISKISRSQDRAKDPVVTKSTSKRNNASNSSAPIIRSRKNRTKTAPSAAKLDKRGVAYTFRVIGISTMLIFYAVPLLMLPFVNELAYLHQLTLWQRLQISILAFSLSFLFVWIGASPQNKKAFAATSRGLKNRVLQGLGYVMFIVGGAYFNGNIMGLLVLHTLQTESYLDGMLVNEVSYQGSKHKSVHLNLRSETSGKSYSLTLSKKHFDYPRIGMGDKIVLQGEKNIFGIYINNYKVN